MKKVKEIIARAIENEIEIPIKEVEYSLSKSTLLMRVWKDEWYLCGNAFTENGNRICFYSSAGIRHLLKGCRAEWSKRDQAIRLYVS
jgi:hypothetical protein